MILYDTCISLHHIYEKNNIRTARVGHLHNPYCITIIRPGDIHHPDVGSHLNLLRYSELCNCFSGITPFSLDILTRSNTLKLFPFLLFLSSSFSLHQLNSQEIIEYHMVIFLQYLPLYRFQL